ncbi:type II toxin-antitoxin system HicA family toxin [Larkinella soli]|uniref:type II toxin-antitoxin system HicA family toxin n=1 Tax=Larkinella soli TaxID=1770527 RepID=UPI000FFC3709|nr:type II toxin-antitoxin system HicA family toxin [Larkinella soli]
MLRWPLTKARLVLSALLTIGWRIKRQSGSHRILERSDWPDYVFAFHDGDEIGPVMLSKIARKTGLKPEDL